MSSQARRDEKRRQWAKEQEAMERECCRIENLSMYDRIEEFVRDEQLKGILHALTEKVGLE